MSKPKILIVGGGIGGLSCATALAETGKFDISIFESDIIGGQASSKKSKLCNTEISWRVFGAHYNNFSSILKTLNLDNKIYDLKKNDACINNNAPWSAVENCENMIETLINIINNNNINKYK